MFLGGGGSPIQEGFVPTSIPTVKEPSAEVEFLQPSEAEEVIRATAARIRAFRGFWFNLEPWTRMESSPAADIGFILALLFLPSVG
jgi:hypothetical protein